MIKFIYWVLNAFWALNYQFLTHKDQTKINNQIFPKERMLSTQNNKRKECPSGTSLYLLKMTFASITQDKNCSTSCLGFFVAYFLFINQR